MEISLSDARGGSILTRAIRVMPFLGAGLLYVPTYYRFGSTIWQKEEYAHGPIVIGLSLWLLWKDLRRSASGPLGKAGAWTLLFAGLCAYVIGRSQYIAMLEIGSQVPVFAALIALLLGWSAVGRFRFPILFLLFAVPLPAAIVDRLTGPLKILVSFVSEGILAVAGLPVARQGVIIQIGQYQLLVADACSGLSSIFSLTALGLFYLHLTRPTHQWRRWALIAAVLPIAIAANTVRVVTLMLITYNFGDAAGQGFLHGFAGMTLFLVALLLLLALDGLFSLLDKSKGER